MKASLPELFRGAASALTLVVLLALPRTAYASMDDWDFAQPAPEVSIGFVSQALVAAPMITLETALLLDDANSAAGPLSGPNGLSAGKLGGAAGVNALMLSITSGTVIYLLNRSHNRYVLNYNWLLLMGLIPQGITQTGWALLIAKQPSGVVFQNIPWVSVVLLQLAGALVTAIVQTAVAHLIREPGPPFGAFEPKGDLLRYTVLDFSFGPALSNPFANTNASTAASLSWR